MSVLLGNDASGNDNNWTALNYSLVDGTTYDSMVDVPTDWGGDTADAGGEVRGSYCVLDNATKGSYVTLSNGGLTLTGNTATNSAVALGTIDVTSGKWYWENTLTTAGGISYIGVGRRNIVWSDLNNAETAGDSTNIVFFARSNGQTFGTGSAKVVSNIGVTFATGDVLGLALDMDSGAIYISKNGTWVTSGVPTSGLSKTGAVFAWTAGTETMTAMGGGYNGSVNEFNFGQRPFTYTPPAGFKSLNTKNIDEQFPFVTGPDLVWIKRRNATSQHVWSDTVRGINRELYSSLTNAEQSDQPGEYVNEFDSNSFTLGSSNAGTGDVNRIGGTYVGWSWNAGSRTIGNQDGTISSTVRVNKDAGFSIVRYTGTGANGTVGHGLGVVPKMIITKSISASGGWPIYHASLGATGAVQLESTGNFNVTSAYWNNTAPSSTNFTLNSGLLTNGTSYIAYCFAEVPGYSKFGSYTGNSSTDGPFIYTGFKPRYVLIKKYSGANLRGWCIYDTARSTANGGDFNHRLEANSNIADDSGSGGGYIDILSNGFILRTSAIFHNESGSNYVYAAFAEAPFKYSNAR